MTTEHVHAPAPAQEIEHLLDSHLFRVERHPLGNDAVIPRHGHYDLVADHRASGPLNTGKPD
jgi:ureidoglycolate hydrolase